MGGGVGAHIGRIGRDRVAAREGEAADRAIARGLAPLVVGRLRAPVVGGAVGEVGGAGGVGGTGGGVGNCGGGGVEGRERVAAARAVGGGAELEVDRPGVVRVRVG